MKTSNTSLFEPVRIGQIELANRIVMAPMTRNRAIGQIPGPLCVEFYRQRASAGLLIAEASHVNPLGQGYVDSPGIHSPEQVVAWSRLVDAVHAAGGKIALQLSHCGRLTHRSLLPQRQAPVSCTARRAHAIALTADGFLDTSTPRALRDDEIPALIDDFVQAAVYAMRAGFDAVEIHAANGYLLDQFLRDALNTRGGAYGGNMVNRCRLLLQIAEAVADAVGRGHVGVRLSPLCTAHDTPRDSDPQGLFNYLVERLSALALAYLHMVEGEPCGDPDPEGAPSLDYRALRRRFSGAWIVNNGYRRDSAMRAVASGDADGVAFGRPFISNPDLVERLRADAPLAPWQSETVLGSGQCGYIDYPPLRWRDTPAR